MIMKAHIWKTCAGTSIYSINQAILHSTQMIYGCLDIGKAATALHKHSAHVTKDTSYSLEAAFFSFITAMQSNTPT